MRRILRVFIRWVLRDVDGPIQATLSSRDSGTSTTPTLRIGLIKAMNGRVLEISTYKHNPHGPDWTNELFLVSEDQTLSQAVAMLLALKGIE